MPDSTKAQLGVRVPAEVRKAAVAKAELNGESLNGYVERLIVQDVGGMPSIAPHPNQLVVGEPYTEDDFKPPADELLDDTPPAVLRKPFAQNCTNGTFHWKHGPGNPCRYCEGEL